MSDESKPRPKPTKVRQSDFSPGTYKLFRQAGFITRSGYLKGTEPEPSKERKPAERSDSPAWDMWRALFEAIRLEATYQMNAQQHWLPFENDRALRKHFLELWKRRKK